jgi:hypothetical protein
MTGLESILENRKRKSKKRKREPKPCKTLKAARAVGYNFLCCLVMCRSGNSIPYNN